MEREKALIVFGAAGLIPGAILGAALTVQLVFANQRQSEMTMLVGIGVAVGAIVGTMLGVLIADHRYPP